MKLFNVIRLKAKINTQQIKIHQLENIIKEGLYQAFIDELYRPKINQLEEEIRLLKMELANAKKGKK